MVFMTSYYFSPRKIQSIDGCKVWLSRHFGHEPTLWRFKFKTPPSGQETEIRKFIPTIPALRGRRIQKFKNFYRNFTPAPSKIHKRTHRKLPVTQVQFTSAMENGNYDFIFFFSIKFPIVWWV